MESKSHWEQVYSSNPSEAVSWYQPHATLSLELIDPRFYHLDTCFCLLSGGEVLYYPPAFSAAGQAQIRAVLGEQLIEAGSDDALHLGVNSVCIGRDVVMCHCSEPTRQALAARGYRVHLVPLGSFNRSGGSAYCLTLKLNNLYQGRVRTSGLGWRQAA